MVNFKVLSYIDITIDKRNPLSYTIFQKTECKVISIV